MIRSQITVLRSKPNAFSWVAIRSFCSSVGGGMPSRERKRRFYVNVDINPCAAPWNDNPINKKVEGKPIISAGIDGTDSASGINRTLELNPERLRRMLTPRIPGTSHNDSLDEAINWFTVTLDGRPLRTPLGRTLALPSLILAHAVAAEWNSVGMTGGSGINSATISNYIVPTQMPFMTLACTALDQTSSQSKFYQEQCLRYLSTDTVCYWADPTEDSVVYDRQQNAWKDLHEWISSEFAPDRPAVAFGHMEGMLLAKGQRGLGHPPIVTKFCERWIESLDAWHLTAMHSICAEAKSFFIGAALLMTNHSRAAAQGGTKFKLDVDGALAAARVEEEFNIESWGLVEGGHDYDRLNASVQLRSASLLTDFMAVTTDQ